MCFQNEEFINNACLKFTKGDEIMKYCVDYIEKWKKITTIIMKNYGGAIGHF